LRPRFWEVSHTNTGVIMKEMKEYTIPFSGLKIGEHQFDFEIDNTFFEYFEYNDFNTVEVALEALLYKKANMLDFTLSFSGIVNVQCDITNEPYDQPIKGTYSFVVKFGEEFNDEEEDILILPHGSHEVNIQQYIYESIILAVPIKKIHPGVEDGTLQSEILDKLEELRPGGNQEEKDNETDPRWDNLKKLLTDK